MNNDWELFVSRPFTFFGTTVWNRWYTSKELKEYLNVEPFRTGLFVEGPKGTVNHFRRKEDLRIFRDGIRKVALDRKHMNEMLDMAEQLNREADDYIASGNEMAFADAVSLDVRLALAATILPYYTGDILAAAQDPEFSALLKRCEKLRGEVSRYAPFLKNVLSKSAERELVRIGLTKNHLSCSTLSEIENADSTAINERFTSWDESQCFVYEYSEGGESVRAVVDGTVLVAELTGATGSTVLKGMSAYKGIARGRVRIIRQLDQSLEEGEVLVGAYTSPAILPLMKKSVAIVTDEGGATCHAAVLSRELRKPCIVGTKHATRVLKDGDFVEVDAEKGLVTKLVDD